MEVPTLPAPAMATFMTVRLRGPGDHHQRVAIRKGRGGDVETLFECGLSVGGDDEVEHVAILPDQSTDIESGHAGPGHRHQGDLTGHVEVEQWFAGISLEKLALHQRQSAGWICPFHLT